MKKSNKNYDKIVIKRAHFLCVLPSSYLCVPVPPCLKSKPKPNNRRVFNIQSIYKIQIVRMPNFTPAMRELIEQFATETSHIVYVLTVKKIISHAHSHCMSSSDVFLSANTKVPSPKFSHFEHPFSYQCVVPFHHSHFLKIKPLFCCIKILWTLCFLLCPSLLFNHWELLLQLFSALS